MSDFTVLDGEGAESTVTVPDGYVVLSNDDLSDGYVSRVDLTAKDSDYMLKASMNRRLKNYVRKDEAYTDESVIAAVLADQPPPAKGATETTFDIDKMKADLRKDEVAPLRTQLDRLHASVKGSTLREASKGLFDERFTSRSPSGGPSWIEAEFGRQTAIDAETGLLLVPDEDGGFRGSRNATNNNPWMTARELMQIAAENPEYAAFLPKEPKGGGGSGSPGSQTPKGTRKGKSNIDTLKSDGLDALLKQMDLGDLVKK